ncbi:MAG: hypothetical protein D6758_04475 [Gammaproteobacteria bacterium]|nr:MAG: hypothetical protein D6758_04475 [Gammaproteobacteria bacterium]
MPVCWLTPDFQPVDEAPSGLQFGDGLFETLLYEDGRLRLWPLHWSRLLRGMATLGLSPPPSENALLAHLGQKLRDTRVAIIKLMVVRHSGQRGYACGTDWRLSIQVHPHRPDPPRDVSVCTLDQTLSGHGLGGIKHMNRLEQILAARELAGRAWEGWLRTPQGEVVEGIRTNLLLIDREGRWFLPDCSRWGVNGTMRALVSDCLSGRNQSVYNSPVPADVLAGTCSAAVMNSIYGVLPVTELDGSPLQTELLASLITEINARIQKVSITLKLKP